MTTFALSGSNAQCPRSFTLTYPKIQVVRGDTLAILADVDSPLDITYNWSISSGKIVGGQGTENIIIAANEVTKSLTATVQLSGLPEGCETKKSVSLNVIPPKNRRAVVQELQNTETYHENKQEYNTPRVFTQKIHHSV